VSAYLAEEPAGLVILDVFPAAGRSTAALYEDDGRTHAYEAGAHALTELACHGQGDTLRITIGPRVGGYADMPAAQTYLLSVHTAARPAQVWRDDAPLTEHPGRAALLDDGAARGWWYDAAAGVVWIKPDAGWRFTADRRGAADPEQDTLAWTTDDRPTGAGYEIALQLSPSQPAAEHRAPTGGRPDPCLPPPDRLRVVANPPERIALKWGDWLPHKTNLYVSLCAGERTAQEATGLVRMEVLDGHGRVIRQAEQMAQRGRVEFLGEEYAPDETVFRFTSPGLEPCEVTIRPAPHVPGRMFGPPAS
jgi:hypothetical protein